MVRINLLPADIIERRRYERFYPYVFVTGAIILGVILALWLGLQLLVSASQDRLQRTEETVTTLKAQAESLRIFEDQQAALAARQGVTRQALAGRIDMGKLCEEISLVLPDSLWLNSLVLSEQTGATFNGYTPEGEDPQIDEGYKSVAAGLVRLNSLATLYDVWLSSASSSSFEEFQSSRTQTGPQGSAHTVQFEITSKIATGTPSPVSTAVPAPPTEAGQ